MIQKIDILRTQIHHLERLYDMAVQTEEKGLESAVRDEMLVLYEEAISLDITAQLKKRYEELLSIKNSQK